MKIHYFKSLSQPETQKLFGQLSNSIPKSYKSELIVNSDLGPEKINNLRRYIRKSVKINNLTETSSSYHNQSSSWVVLIKKVQDLLGNTIVTKKNAFLKGDDKITRQLSLLEVKDKNGKIHTQVSVHASKKAKVKR